MNVLVTGGAGFIGSHLIERLLNEGHYVVCVDNLLTGNKKNISCFLQKENFDFIEKDIVDLKFFDMKVPLDQIYNLACAASPEKYQKNPIHTIKTNTSGVMNLLSIAKLYNARILQASTSEVYGDPLIHPQSESYLGNVNPVGKRSCYDEGKRMAETLFTDYNRMYNTDTRIARIFNTYGEGMQPDDGRVVINFINQSLRNIPLTIYGDGQQTRSLCYVSDLVEGLIRLMNAAGDYHTPFNLGNPEEIKVIELANKIIKLTKSSSQLKFLDLPEDDPIKRKPDINKAKKALQWKPVVSLDDGLYKIMSFYKKT